MKLSFFQMDHWLLMDDQLDAMQSCFSLSPGFV